MMLGIVGLVTWAVHALHADRVHVKIEMKSYSRTRTIRNGETSVSEVTSPPRLRDFLMKKTKPTLEAKKKRLLQGVQ